MLAVRGRARLRDGVVECSIKPVVGDDPVEHVVGLGIGLSHEPATGPSKHCPLRGSGECLEMARTRME